jgi:beta-1,4-mannosyltransferase
MTAATSGTEDGTGLRVLQSFPTGTGTTNPYLVQLSSQLGPQPEVLGFTWRRALLARYDVFHVHWPETLLHGSTPARSLARRTLLRALLLRLWLARTRTAVVRTLHDAHSQGTGSRAERAVLARLDGLTTLWIRLSPATPVRPDAVVRTIEHGDYRAWFASVDVGPVQPGLLLYFGLIRPSKGIPALIDAFGALPAGPLGEPIALRVVGSPTTSDVGAEVLLAALADDRVTVLLGHADDAELAAEVTRSELVVLPYRDLHGSAAAVLALSLGRPILVPRSPATEALRAEVGRGWVFTYPGALTADDLGAALASCRSEVRLAAGPDLSDRAWPVIAAKHRAAYADALRLANGTERSGIRDLLPAGSPAPPSPGTPPALVADEPAETTGAEPSTAPEPA